MPRGTPAGGVPDKLSEAVCGWDRDLIGVGHNIDMSRADCERRHVLHGSGEVRAERRRGGEGCGVSSAQSETPETQAGEESESLLPLSAPIHQSVRAEIFVHLLPNNHGRVTTNGGDATHRTSRRRENRRIIYTSDHSEGVQHRLPGSGSSQQRTRRAEMGLD